MASLKTLLLLSALVLVACSKVYTVKDPVEGIDLKFELQSNKFKVSFSVPRDSVNEGFIFHAHGPNGDCPGFAYFFRKEFAETLTMTLSSGCTKEEEKIRIRKDLAFDFSPRTTDEFRDGKLYFEGEITYPHSIDKFEFEKYTKARVIRRSVAGKAFSDKVYPLN